VGTLERLLTGPCILWEAVGGVVGFPSALPVGQLGVRCGDTRPHRGPGPAYLRLP